MKTGTRASASTATSPHMDSVASVLDLLFLIMAVGGELVISSRTKARVFPKKRVYLNRYRAPPQNF